MKSNRSGKTLRNSAFDFGGDRPKVFGVSLSRKLLGCFVYEGEKFEFNFSKFWTKSRINFSFSEADNENNRWRLKAKNKNSLLVLEMTCPKKEMLLINYEAPDGNKRHQRLWNGGTGSGRLKLYRLKGFEKELIDDISFYHTGCEYGEY